MWIDALCSQSALLNLVHKVQLARVLESPWCNWVLCTKLDRHPHKARYLDTNLLQCLRCMLRLQGFNGHLDEIWDGCCYRQKQFVSCWSIIHIKMVCERQKHYTQSNIMHTLGQLTVPTIIDASLYDHNHLSPEWIKQYILRPPM